MCCLVPKLCLRLPTRTLYSTWGLDWESVLEASSHLDPAHRGTGGRLGGWKRGGGVAPSCMFVVLLFILAVVLWFSLQFVCCFDTASTSWAAPTPQKSTPSSQSPFSKLLELYPFFPKGGGCFLWFFNYFYFNLFLAVFVVSICWVFVAVHRLPPVAASRGYSSLRCMGFSLRWLLCCGARALGAWASVVVARGLSTYGSRALERRHSSCGSRA